MWKTIPVDEFKSIRRRLASSKSKYRLKQDNNIFRDISNLFQKTNIIYLYSSRVCQSVYENLNIVKPESTYYSIWCSNEGNIVVWCWTKMLRDHVWTELCVLVIMRRKFHATFFRLHCKDHSRWLYNLLGRKCAVNSRFSRDIQFCLICKYRCYDITVHNEVFKSLVRN